VTVRPLIAIPICLALALGGCSLTQKNANTTTPKATGPAKAIGDVISSFSSDASSGNSKTICDSILAASLVSQLNKVGGCQNDITNQIDTVSSFTLTVTKYGVSGDTATAVVKSDDNGTTKLYTLALVKQGKSWRISGLSPAS